MILAIFDLQVTLLLPTKFQVNWPFGSGGEAINKFSRGPPWRPSWDFQMERFYLFFDLQVTPMLPTKFQVNSGEKVKNRFSRWSPWWPSWISDW